MTLVLFGQPTYALVSKKTWEEEYARGHWNRLEKLEELSRYSVIVGYFDYYVREGYLSKNNILDVGCGHGILQKKLAAVGYSAYKGIDVSSEAIAVASENKDKATTFIQADIRDFETTEKYDCIIFNEVLVYLEDPLTAVRKYRDFLTRQGIIIISQYCDKTLDIEQTWSSIDEVIVPADEIKLSHPSGKSWIVKVYNP